MTIAIGPKNEASTIKSLKLAKIKDFTKICLFWLLLGFWTLESMLKDWIEIAKIAIF